MKHVTNGKCCQGHEIILLPKDEQPKLGELIYYCQGCSTIYTTGEWENEYWKVEE
jgi:hypothetical protein